MPEWPRVEVGSLVEDGAISYGIVQPGSETPEGVPIVRVKDLRDGVVSLESPLRVHRSVSERHSRTVLHGGELLVSLVGSVGQAAIAPPEASGWNVARAIAVLRPKGVTADWLKFCFKTQEVQAQIAASLNTTVQATLNLSDLKRIRVSFPPEDVRRRITEVLGALDDKIAANTTLVNVADGLSRAMFTALPKTDLLPLSSVAQFVNGKAFTKNATGTGKIVVRIAELNSGIGNSTVYNDIEVPDQYLARPGDILFAWSGSLTLHRWYRDEAIVNQHIFKVMPNEGYPSWLIWGLISAKLDEFRAIAADKATTMGHIQRRHLDEPVSVPASEVIANNDTMMTALWKRALAAERENLVVAATRDALLPGLMSGKLRVRDAERVAEEVA